VDDVMRGGRLVALVAQRTDTAGSADPDNLYRVGTAGIIHQLARMPDGSLRLSKAQRQFYLREQLRSIQTELGEKGEADATDETAELRRQIEAALLPEEARTEADRELRRLAGMAATSSEYGLTRSYLEWMASLPWNILTGREIDVARTQRVLDEDHYDLEKVKERILERLAVKKLRHDRHADAGPAGQPDTGEEAPPPPGMAPGTAPAREPILCFVGPPGVGKTSLGQSIARALGCQFVRMALGGLHDEAEVRGHRRTYIGAMPGRII
jgi:ATP-dependent Lon protease